MSKKCPKCHESKSINDFCQKKSSSQYSHCKNCRILTNRTYSQKRTAEQKTHRNTFTQERRDFIYDTNPFVNVFLESFRVIGSLDLIDSIIRLSCPLLKL